MKRENSPSLLFEMLRSFASLARSLNLSKTIKEMASTRQTVRRHIALLEEYKGNPLFRLENRQYVLTDLGQNSLREAEELLSRAEAWLHNESRHVNDLHYLALQEGDTPYFLQQHPLTSLWDHSSDLLRYGFHAWAKAEGELESPALALLRPYLMVFRFNADNGDWICTEVGERSSFATWFGWEKFRSTIGKSALNLPSGPGYGHMLTQSFHDIATTRSVRLDHVHTRLGHGPDNELTPINYQRLGMACRFPDGEFALATLIDRTVNVKIQDLPEDMRLSMPPEFEMNVPPPEQYEPVREAMLNMTGHGMTRP